MTVHTITANHDEDLVHSSSDYKGGRSGTIETPDQQLNITPGNPLEQGAEELGPSPKLLFAAAYSACYCHGAPGGAAKKLATPVEDTTVRAVVSRIGFSLEN